jgi:hypothetical protein
MNYRIFRIKCLFINDFTRNFPLVCWRYPGVISSFPRVFILIYQCQRRTRRPEETPLTIFQGQTFFILQLHAASDRACCVLFRYVPEQLSFRRTVDV